MKKITTFIVLFLASLAVWAQGPNGTGTYYRSGRIKVPVGRTQSYNYVQSADIGRSRPDAQVFLRRV